MSRNGGTGLLDPESRKAALRDAKRKRPLVIVWTADMMWADFSAWLVTVGVIMGWLAAQAKSASWRCLTIGATPPR
jgi:hypothetical protein